MNAFLLSFRLHDPEFSEKILAELGQEEVLLSRQEKYDNIKDYLISISIEGSVNEDDTTSLIFFKTTSKTLKSISTEIIEKCKLSSKDELFFIKFEGKSVCCDCRISNRQVIDENSFKRWIS